MITPDDLRLLVKDWKAHADDIPGYYARDPSGDTPSLVLLVKEDTQGKLHISATSLRDLGRIIADNVPSGDVVKSEIVLG